LPSNRAAGGAGTAASPGWFDYDEAFSRNIGWFTEVEQQRLRTRRVAIAGMGGVGGIHMLTLARLGVGRFSVADFDRFELANFNRQMGASARTLGQPKAQSVVMLAREINPEIDVRLFDTGIDEANLDAFLDGADVYIDGLDFFVLDLRRKLFARARERGIPAITAAPMGMGTGYLVFTPDGMSFEDYFRLEGRDPDDQAVRFLLGLTPALLHSRYLADSAMVDMAGKRGPSTAIACQLCAGVAATEAVKLMLGRGTVRPAPWFHHFDPYLGRFVSRRLGQGNAGPVQRLRIAVANRLSRRYARTARPPETPLPTGASVMDHILDLARWAPSPDNSQPWTIVERGERDLLVAMDLEPGNPYQFRGGLPNWLAAGMFLQSLRLAAARCGWRMVWSLEPESPTPQVRVHFADDPAVPVDPLVHLLKARSVERGRYRLKPVSDADKAALAEALGPGFRIHWRETLAQRWRTSLVNARAAGLRLASRRCFRVHQQVIDWSQPFSPEGLPGRAIGVDPLGQRLLRWSLGGWPRMRFLNRWLFASAYAGLVMDLIPGLFCGAHFVIEQRLAPGGRLTPTDLLIVGERLQRFWLEATGRGLVLQPTLAPLFAGAQVDDAEPTLETALLARAEAISKAHSATLEAPLRAVVFQGRLGWPKQKSSSSRSVRAALT